MRWPRWRLTIRSVMLAVAMEGVVFAGVSLRLRQRQYQARAAVHAALAAEQRLGGSGRNTLRATGTSQAVRK